MLPLFLMNVLMMLDVLGTFKWAGCTVPAVGSIETTR
jgi:hypothetical protein